VIELHRMDRGWRAQFDPDTPNDVILLSALSGHCPATASLDRADDPHQIFLRAHGGKAFASLGVREDFLHDAVDRASTQGWTALADTGVPESVRRRGRVVERLRFDQCDLEAEALHELRGNLPSAVEWRLLDRDLFEQCHHAKRELPDQYGDTLNAYFESFGYGICLLHGENIVCEAYAGHVADDRMEAIVGTVDAFRGRGLASIAAAFLADEARMRGHTFTWNCLADNLGSVKVARRLAFRRERPYREIYF